MFLEKSYHDCTKPRWESDGVICFEDGGAVFKYDCVATETSSNYKHSHSRVVREMTQPCGATKRVTLAASSGADERTIEMLEAAGSDRSDAVELLRVDPPTPDDPNGQLIVEIHDDQVIYR